jgi:hypothetical protein
VWRYRLVVSEWHGRGSVRGFQRKLPQFEPNKRIGRRIPHHWMRHACLRPVRHLLRLCQPLLDNKCSEGSEPQPSGRRESGPVERGDIDEGPIIGEARHSGLQGVDVADDSDPDLEHVRIGQQVEQR